LPSTPSDRGPRAYAGAQLVVFDLDGTLVDSLRDLAESANALLAACGAEPLPAEEIGRMVGDGAAALVSRAFAAAGRDQPRDALPRFLAIYNSRLLRLTSAYPGIPETLDRLAANFPLAVLTNKPLDPTRQILDGLGLARYFIAVIGGDGPFPRKPDPSGMFALCRMAAVAVQNAVLVGDSAVDWKTARAAGARCCLASYGFGFASVPVAELAETEHVIEHARMLLDLL
jgi:phosphoglycolate phosphatase